MYMSIRPWDTYGQHAQNPPLWMGEYTKIYIFFGIFWHGNSVQYCQKLFNIYKKNDSYDNTNVKYVKIITN